jgi:hypothetical protein
MIGHMYTIVYNKILVYLTAFLRPVGRFSVYSWIHAYAFRVRTDGTQNGAWDRTVLSGE